MPAKLFQVSSATLERLNQMQARNASSAAFAGSFLVESDHDGGTMIFPGYPRGDYAKHALMPATPAHHDRRVPHWIMGGANLLFSCDKCFFFYLLTIAVLPIQKLGQSCSFAFIIREEKA